MAVLRDLAEITHWVSVVKITPDAADDPTVSPDERARGLAMADRPAHARDDTHVANAAQSAWTRSQAPRTP